MNGGRLPDPGLAAICARCNEPREAHGGPKHYGACPDQSGLRASRFQLQESDKPSAPDPKRMMSAGCPHGYALGEVCPSGFCGDGSGAGVVVESDRIPLDRRPSPFPVERPAPLEIEWRHLYLGEEYPADRLISCSLCGCAVELDDVERHRVWHEAMIRSARWPR